MCGFYQEPPRPAGIVAKSVADGRVLGLRMGANMLGRSERTGVSDARVSRQQLVLFVTEAKTVVVFCLGRNPVSVKRSAAAESELVAVRGSACCRQSCFGSTVCPVSGIQSHAPLCRRLPLRSLVARWS